MTAQKTFKENPHLFKIVTPIKVDRLEHYLNSHPNQAFVRSVCKGFCEGFWPWADTSDPGLPETWDNSGAPPKDPEEEKIINRDVQNEVRLSRYSEAFGPELLPGMFSMPVFARPKPRSTRFWVIVNHSAEPHSLNSTILREDVSVTLDNIHDLGRSLREFRVLNEDSKITLFKSDIAQAYRQLPMHPLWQIQQIVTLRNSRHVDCCNIWGNRAAGNLYCSFMGLVNWIAIKLKGLNDLLSYVDDDFSWDIDGNLEFYEPYDWFMPEKQIKLLELWDELGVPHKKEKQVYGSPLTIIGFEVDANAMTVTMPEDSRMELIDALLSFAKHGQRRPLREFQRLGGWVNWALNVYPLLRPGLSCLYQKIRGKSQPNQSICVSVVLCREPTWLTQHIRNSTGIHMLNAQEWSAEDADEVVFADACPSRMGFWIPSQKLGFQYAIPVGPEPRIFFFEALAVVSSLTHVLNTYDTPPKHLVIFTDNQNTVDMFNSARAAGVQPPSNHGHRPHHFAQD